MNIQARVALDKVKNPERYCGDRRCLWALRSGPCPKHSDVLVPVQRLQAIHDAGSAMAEARDSLGRRPPQAKLRNRLQPSTYGLLPASQAPAVHRPPQMREPDGEWRPLLTGLDGGAS